MGAEQEFCSVQLFRTIRKTLQKIRVVPKAGLVIFRKITLFSNNICPKGTVMSGYENQWLVTKVSHDLWRSDLSA